MLIDNTINFYDPIVFCSQCRNAAMFARAANHLFAMVTSKGQGVMNEQQAVRAAVDQWFVALNAMLGGDPKPLAKVYSHADDVIYLGAEGTYQIGWKATYNDWKAQAAMSIGGKAKGEDIRVVVNGEMAMAVHYTQGTLRQPGGKTARVRVRETSVFRKEDGKWRMIAHHADSIPYWEQAYEM